MLTHINKSSNFEPPHFLKQQQIEILPITKHNGFACGIMKKAFFRHHSTSRPFCLP